MKNLLSLLLLFPALSLALGHARLECLAQNGISVVGPSPVTLSTLFDQGNCSATSGPITSEGTVYSSRKYRYSSASTGARICNSGGNSNQDSYVKFTAGGKIILVGLPPFKVSVDEKLWMKFRGYLEVDNVNSGISAQIKGCLDAGGKIIEFTNIQPGATITPQTMSGNALLQSDGSNINFTETGDLQGIWTDVNYKCTTNSPGTSTATKETDSLMEIQFLDVYPRVIADMNMCIQILSRSADFSAMADFQSNDGYFGLFAFNPNQNPPSQGNPPPLKGSNSKRLAVAPVSIPTVIVLPGNNMPPNVAFQTGLLGVPLFQFNLYALNGNITVTDVTLRMSNDYGSISQADLYLDSDGDGRVSSGDTPLGTAMPDSQGKLNFTGLNINLNQDTEVDLLVTVSTSSQTPADSIQLSVLDRVDIAASGTIAVVGVPVYSALLLVSAAGCGPGNCTTAFPAGGTLLLIVPGFVLALRLLRNYLHLRGG